MYTVRGKDLRILYVVNILAVGGSEMFLLRKIQKLRERGHYVALAYCEKRGANIDLYLQQYLQNQLLFDLSYDYKSVVPLLNELRVNIFHTVQAHPRFLFFAKRANSGLICVSTVTGNVWRADRWFNHRKYTDAIVTKASAFLAILQDRLIRPPHRMQVIENGIALDNESSPQLSLPPDIPRDKKIILQIARMHPDKNVEDSLLIAKKVCENRSDCIFFYAGANYGELQGRYFRNLCKLKQKLQLNDRYFFIGERSDVAGLLSMSNFVINTTRVPQGTPNALLETLSVGRPIVALRCPGISDVVKHQKTGYIAEGIDDAVQTIKTLLDNPDLCLEMGRAAREYARQMFDINQSITKYENLYRELLRLRRL